MSGLEILPAERYSIERYASREDWLQGRLTCVGGSDVSALVKDEMGLSLNPWKSEYGLWAEKTGHAVTSEEENEAMYWGRVFEPAIAEWYAMKTGRKLSHDSSFTLYRSKKHPHRAVSTDRVIEPIDDRGPGVLSIKNVGSHKRDDWDAAELDEDRMGAIVAGADFTDWEPPEHYQIQLQYELGVTGYKWGSFAVCIGGQKGIWCDVERNDEFIEWLFEQVDGFWQRVKTLAPPPVDGDENTTAVLKRMWRSEASDDKIVKLSDDAQERTYEITKIESFLKGAKTRRKELLNLLRDEIKDAVIGELPKGGIWRWKTNKANVRVLRRMKNG